MTMQDVSGSEIRDALRCEIPGIPRMVLKRVLFLILLVVPAAVEGQYLGHSFTADVTRGETLYRAACVSCHGGDGKGAPRSIAGFQQPRTFPDFTKCDQTTPEVDSAYKDVIVHGGPNR